MVSLAQIDLKLQNSFLAIKEDMNSFRKRLEHYSERISALEDSIQKTKELNKRLSVLEDAEDNKKELEKLYNAQEKELRKLQGIKDDFVSKEEFENLSSEIEEIRKELQTKTKEPEKPKEEKKKKKEEKPKEEEEKPKKKIFDKVIDFFAEED